MGLSASSPRVEAGIGWQQPLHRCQSPNLPKTIYEGLFRLRAGRGPDQRKWSNRDTGDDPAVGFTPGNGDWYNVGSSRHGRSLPEERGDIIPAGAMPNAFRSVRSYLMVLFVVASDGNAIRRNPLPLLS
jgi:hypothetical protein